MVSLFPNTMSLDDLIITDQRLGEGGFGSVFACQLSEKKVAAKKLSQSEKEFSNLVREASRLKRLQYGKHIAYTYGIALKEESLYMIMECSEHGDLQNYLKRNKELVTYEQKILFCHGLLLGLLYCHSMKVFHGDIKCSNVILGKNLEPKLMDFGLSITVDNVEYYSKLYKESLYWTAPELFSIKEDEAVYREFIANPYPCDVYSLGATFCEISYDGTTDFIDSDDESDIDIMLGNVYPIPKDAFLQKIVDECCQFECNERMSLDECLSALDNVAEEQLLIPAIDEKWREMQQDIKTNSKLKLPPAFILHRPAENLVVGPSNLSLLEWLCISNHVGAVEYMIQLYENDQNLVKWLYKISELCGSFKVTEFLQSFMLNKEFSCLKLSNLIDSNPQQFIEMLIKAGANCCSYDLLKKAIEKHRNTVLQAIIVGRNHFKNWAIHDAVKFGNAEAVEILANAGADLEWCDYQTGYTPLEIAIETENIKIVRILLGLGTFVDKTKRNTPHSREAKELYKWFCLAALKGNRETVKLLIDAGAATNITNKEWYSLYQILEEQGYISMARFIRNIISKNSSPVENSSLCAVIRNKQSDLVQALTIDNGSNIDEIGMDGYAPLHWAVVVGDEEIVKSLIRAGADLDIRTSNKTQNLDSAFASDYLSDCTPLHIAISKRYLEISRLLIESGADFSAKDGLQQTIMDIAKEEKEKIEKIVSECAPINVISIRRIMKSMSLASIKIVIDKQLVNTEILSECLCIAASSGKDDLVKYLLKYEANNSKKHWGRTPLGWAIFGGNIQTIRILMNASTSLNTGKQDKKVLLIKSIIESNTNMIQFLVEKGADVNTKDANGKAPIYYADSKKSMEILINAGADPNVRDIYGKTLLVQNIEKSNLEIVQFLVEKGVDVNEKDENGYTPIHHANDRKIMKTLIDAKADVDAKDQDGTTPLIHYVKKSNREIVQFLVEKGADVNAKDKKGNAPICYADNKGIMKILINAGADPYAKCELGRTLLVQNIRKSNAEIVRFLIEKGADVNAKVTHGNMPICYAKNREIMKILINAGVDLNIRDVYGKTLLVQNIEKSNLEIVRFLVEKGADVNAKDERGNAPIHYVKDMRIMKILIDAKADVDAKNRYGETPLIHYVKELNIEIVQFLVEKGADVNVRDVYGNAPIHYANSRKIMEILINAGASINEKDRDGEIPLIHYVKELNIEIVQFLVKKGADVNARDVYGNAPIHYANSRKIMEILINTGASINEKDRDGEIPLIHHVKESNTEAVRFLVEKGADVNARDKDENAAIHCTKNNEIMKILMNAGAYINAKNQYGIAPLIQFVIESNIDMVQFLIEKGADVNVRDVYRNAPIHHANSRKIMEILINTGASINEKDQYGETPLIHHVKGLSTEMVQFLIEKGADVNTSDKDGNAPIHHTDNRELLEILINAGADVNAKNQYGRTYLIKHSSKLNTEIIQFLIEKGADINSRDKDGKALIHFVRDKEIAEILINAGADINAKDQYKEELFDILIKEQNKNLSNSQYKRKKVCGLLEYLRDRNRNKV